MNRILYLVVVVLLFQTVGMMNAQSNWGQRKNSPYDLSLRSLSFDEVDFSQLADVAEQRERAVERDDVDRMVEENIRFIFHNKLNRNRFLVIPRPEQVIERVQYILELDQEMAELIQEGRRIAADQSYSPRCHELVSEVGDRARVLKDEFRDYFVELKGSAYTLRLPNFDDSPGQFVYFLVQSERIHSQLTQRLDEYFLNPSPGAVTVSNFQESSIVVLAESLSKLSQEIEKKLR